MSADELPKGRDHLVVLVDGGHAGEAHDRLLAHAVRVTLAAEGILDAEVSVALLDDQAIRRLNREHLGHDRATDVVAFGLWESGEPVVGDVYLGYEQAERQAAEVGVPLTEELARLAVHGTLHVLGWEHPEGEAERASSPMWRRQEGLVKVVLAEGAEGGSR